MSQSQAIPGMPTHAPLDGAGERGHGIGLMRLLSHGSSLSGSRRLTQYLGIALAILTTIWTPVGLFLILKPPSYTSTWALILPGSGAGHAVSLESVGQASATPAPVTDPML